MDDATFTKRFRQAFYRRGLSVRVVAALLGCSRATVARYLAGQNAPHPMMREIALSMVEV